jgi:hypothetical protein
MTIKQTVWLTLARDFAALVGFLVVLVGGLELLR